MFNIFCFYDEFKFLKKQAASTTPLLAKIWSRSSFSQFSDLSCFLQKCEELFQKFIKTLTNCWKTSDIFDELLKKSYKKGVAAAGGDHGRGRDRRLPHRFGLKNFLVFWTNSGVLSNFWRNLGEFLGKENKIDLKTLKKFLISQFCGLLGRRAPGLKTFKKIMFKLFVYLLLLMQNRGLFQLIFNEKLFKFLLKSFLILGRGRYPGSREWGGFWRQYAWVLRNIKILKKLH